MKMQTKNRTHSCGEVNPSLLGKQIVCNGWVHRNRNHGGIHFITLRDRYGIVQVVIDEDARPETRELASSLKYEYCIAVEGTVRKRPASMINPNMVTGEIELLAQNIHVFSSSDPLPFMIDERSSANEDLRLQYRYLDLRSFAMQRNIRLRAQVSQSIRTHLVSQGFLEIETPTMIRSTPEGARDFLIPSRLNKGKFYAMPQSPQLFKQLLMVSGFDRYFQIAHCFRDEDLRGDRQPEHTQIDIEMSFVSTNDVLALCEGLMKHVFAECLGIALKTPFRRISFDDAMNSYGSDKPDLRFDLEIQDFGPFVEGTGFGVFESALEAGGVVKVLRLPKASNYSRKKIQELEDIAKVYGAKGLAWTKFNGEQFDGGIGKFIISKIDDIRSSLGLCEGDLLLFAADKWKTACTVLGAIRKHIGQEELGETGAPLQPTNFAFAWVLDFPLFEYNEERHAWDATHHPFSKPQEQYLDNLEQNPATVKGELYDLVCNGLELASGSIRIHDKELQNRVFEILGFDQTEAEKRFGFLLQAFNYGAPPHGGIAPGLDRLLMLMTGEASIREVIAFPKNTVGANPLDDSPSQVSADQLKELGLAMLENIDPNKTEQA